MKSLWSDQEAREYCERYKEWGEDIALRVYTSRLIGRETDLVMHGGGNTSVKTLQKDILGRPALWARGPHWSNYKLHNEGASCSDLLVVPL